MNVMQCDVLVVGSGVSGIAAAVAAAREGAKVTIIERDGFVGGLASGAWVGTICGAARCGVASYRSVLTGWPATFVEEIALRSGTTPQCTRDLLWYLPYDPTALRLISADTFTEHEIVPLVHATVHAVELHGNDVVACFALAWDQQIKITPRTVIDCSGEAIVSHLAGIPSIESEEYQAPSLVFEVRIPKPMDEREFRFTLMHDVGAGITAGKLARDFERLSVVPGSVRGGRALLKFALGALRSREATSVPQLSAEGMRLIEQLERWILHSNGDLSSMQIDSIAPSIGIRTGRRILGRSVLHTPELCATTVPTDTIAIGTWPIEEWIGGREPRMMPIPAGSVYGISAGCLESAHLNNLFAAGRCISADDGAIASARVIGTGIQTGWAAGLLAAHHDRGLDRATVISRILPSNQT